MDVRYSQMRVSAFWDGLRHGLLSIKYNVQFHWVNANRNYVMYYVAEWISSNSSYYSVSRHWKVSVVVHHPPWQPQLHPGPRRQPVLTNMTAGYRHHCDLAQSCLALPPQDSRWYLICTQSLQCPDDNNNKGRQSITDVTLLFGFDVI